ncbi:MAG: type III pantothenate kinase [Elusimicrobia bacterium]|nr:type III pantothenate kinase [Elusimicrobiota bacterium]MBU2615459.1 type III pantothenate kinase [Elusimicrobiota bacterium]
MSVLAFDIGNTSITSGVFKKNKLVKLWRMPSDTALNKDAYLKDIKKNLGAMNFDNISGIVISSVVPKLDKKFVRISNKLFKKNPLFANSRNCGINILYKKPDQVGADRLVNAVAGYKLFGGPLIIIDFGTAITFDCINKKGDYLGGLIIPGIGLSAKALNVFTAKLPLIENLEGKPKNLIGETTQESIKSGIYYGYTGLVQHISEMLKKKLKCDRIILTGGQAGILAKELKFKIVPELTLLGLKYIWEKNRRRGN